MTDKIVAIDTDNLDDFDMLLSGKATAPVEPVVEAIVEDVDIDDPEANSLADEPEDTTDADADDVSDQDDDTPAPKKKTVQERINELTAARREAERREAEALRNEAEARRKLEEALLGRKDDKEAVAVSGEPDPDALLEDGNPKYPLGDYDPAYIRDLIKFSSAQELQAHETANKQTQAEAQAQLEKQALRDVWTDKITETQKVVPDFVEKVDQLETTFTSLDQGYGEYLASTIMGLDEGPDVLYYLSNHLEEAQAIVQLGPVAATGALFVIQERLKAGKETPKPPKVSNAPTPPSAIVRGSSSKSNVAVDTDDLDAFTNEFFKK